jgi:superoxide dismutase, Fe-Mn family
MDDRTQPAAMAPAMALALAANFGSVARWREAFASLGKGLGGGPGSVLLCFLPRQGTLVHRVSADPAHAMADAVPLLSLDMRKKHDHDADAAAQVDAFMVQIDWAPVYERYQAAVHAASDGFGVSQDEMARGTLLDVRRRGVFEQSAQMLPGATWRDPMDVAQWAASLEPGAPVTVYCVYGHEVGRSTALRLRAAGVDARFLEGGIDAWARAGKPLADKSL